ncbi:MAG: hypothetical protein M0Q38_12085 [Bacteroidales bacterium]|nr:hypothetical protein [Bacteroidales bacterium]
MKNHPEEIPSVKQELYEIFHELPVGSKNLIETIIEDEKVDAAETDQIKGFIYREGHPGGYEIRLLFEIHDHVYGHNNDPSWEKFFLDETTEYFTENSNVKRKLPFAKAAMLYDQIKKTIKRIGMVSEVEMALLKKIIEITGDLIYMNGTDKRFLSGLFEEVLRDEKIDFNEVEMLKEMICQNSPPLEEDIDLLFDINLAIIDKPRDDFWQVLFVESVLLYMINKPSEINNKKTDWLERKFHRTTEKHQRLTPEEIELINALKQQTNEFPPVLNAYWTEYCQ